MVVTHADDPWAIGIIVLLAAAFSLYQMLRPTPPADLSEIELFLRNRDERLVRLGRSLLMLGTRPGGFFYGGSTYRFYIVTASDKAGARYSHRLALSNEGPKRPQVLQRLDGVWTDVHQ